MHISTSIRSWLVRCAGAAIALCAVTATAADLSPQDAIAARQVKYKEIGGALKTIMTQLKADAPDTAVIAASAATIADDAQAQIKLFPAGSGAEAGVKTRAKPEIWLQRPQFESDNASLVAEAQKLSAIAQGGDLTAIRAQAPVLGAACGTCHKVFRGPEG